MLLECRQHVRHLFRHDAGANGRERCRQTDLKARAWRDLAGGPRVPECGIGVERNPVVADRREFYIGRFQAG